MRRVWGLAGLVQGAEPEWVVAEGAVDVVGEFDGGGVGDCDVLDCVAFGEAALVQGVVHDPGVQVLVEHPAGEAVEGREEVLEAVGADPESAAVVTEEVVHQGDEFDRWGFGVAADEFVGVEIEPWILGTAEMLHTPIAVVGQAAGTDHTAVLSQQNAIHIII